MALRRQHPSQQTWVKKNAILGIKVCVVGTIMLIAYYNFEFNMPKSFEMNSRKKRDVLFDLSSDTLNRIEGADKILDPDYYK